MASPLTDRGAQPGRPTRRQLLAAGLALAVSGCTLSDPAVRGQGPVKSAPSPALTPMPTPTAPAPASVELRLAALAATVQASPGRPTASSAAVLELVHRSHLERAAALTAPDPAARPTQNPSAPSPSPSPSASPTPSRGEAVRSLVAAERRAASDHRRAALAADGLTALLLGSMSVASGRFVVAVTAGHPPAAAPLQAHRPTALVADTDAVAALVSSLHALVYGYQLALGRLPVGSGAHDRAAAGLQQRRALLHRLSDVLVEAGAKVPAASPAYQPSPEPTDARTAGLLIRRMETALVPFCGLWLAAAARPADRTLALDTLAATTATAESWGAPLLAWPGYRD